VDYKIIFSLLGGLALFLMGMQMMSTGLEAAAGNRMKRILEKLTTNRFLGVLVGAAITAVIQSSSATTVMVVGFVNSRLMTLNQAVWVIMGANIGTTITGQLIALDVGEIAPLIAFAGVALIVFIKRDAIHHWGQILAGLGILFIGMDMMSSAMMPLRESETFVNLMTKFSNPLLGIVVGMVFTAIIQSSSASVGILQALAMSGVIGLPNAVYVLFGQNIGTCITALLASIGTSRNAKRTTIVHLLFNVIGTILFTLVCAFTPLTSFVASWTPNNVAAQIANMHTLFNVVTTLLLLPFGNQLAKLVVKILPEKKVEAEMGPHLKYIKSIEATQEYHIGLSAIAIGSTRMELTRMLHMVRTNVDMSYRCVLDGTTRHLKEVEEEEDYIDYLNAGISDYISHLIAHELNEKDSETIGSFFKICGNLERIGDHAMNICEYTKRMEKKHTTFSKETRAEIGQMRDICLQTLDLLGKMEPVTPEAFEKITAAEQKIDDMTAQFRHNQLKRLRGGECSNEECVLYSEMLTDFERIGDHILNIGEALKS